MKFDINELKKPQSWAIIIPAFLLIWAFMATINMLDKQSDAQSRIQKTRQALQYARSIQGKMREFGDTGIDQSQIKTFDLVTSARKCAKAAAIPIEKLSEGSISAGKKRKDGSVQRNQNYNLKSVRMFQIAKFIDFAEQNYSSLNSSKINIAPSPTKKSKDLWNATITFQYIKK